MFLPWLRLCKRKRRRREEIKTRAKSRIGLFGGTFNPVHSGHLKAAFRVRDRFSLEKVFFIPCYIPPHKGVDVIASPEHRLKMVELACAPYDFFIPSRIEIERAGTSYSIITLKKFEKLFPQALMFFILGIDAFLEIETWKDYSQLLESCFFIVMSRPGYSLEEARAVLGGSYRERIFEVAEHEELEVLFSEYRVFLIEIDALDVSASEIRQRVRQGVPIRGLVPENVEKYIKENRIYH